MDAGFEENEDNPDEHNKPNMRPISFDNLFKGSMQNLHVARDFFESHLPAAIIKDFELSTLKVESAEFTSRNQRPRRSDILYSARRKGRLSYIYTLVEQQTDPDALQPLRRLEYSLAAMRNHLNQHPNEKYLPVILNVFFYNGRYRHTQPVAFTEMFHPDDAEFACANLMTPAKYIDLHRLNDSDIIQHKSAACFELAMRHVYDQAITSLLSLLDERRDILLGGEYREYSDLVLNFAMSRLQPSQICELQQEVSNTLSDELGDQVMNLGTALLHEGYDKGIKEGIEKGIEQGIEQGMRTGLEKVALKLLDQGFDVSTVAKLTELSEAEILQIQE